MQLEILSPDNNFFTGEVDSAQFPGANGSFEILNDHAAFISSLVEGKIKYKYQSKVETIQIKSGFVEVLNNKVIVLIQETDETAG